MVFTVTDEGGREPEHLGLSETRPNGDLGEERVPFGERRGGVEYSACGLLSLHGPIFLPKAGRTWITRGSLKRVWGEEMSSPLAVNYVFRPLPQPVTRMTWV